MSSAFTAQLMELQAVRPVGDLPRVTVELHDVDYVVTVPNQTKKVRAKRDRSKW
jgi:hypothetical protein